MDFELSSSTLMESFERFNMAPNNENGNDSNHDGDNANGNESQTNLENNHEKIDSNSNSNKKLEPVDVDLNFLKYLLESHASQLGGAGPATQLLSQLGIILPHLPPMNDKNVDDME